jgi:hypothetical protein
MARRDEQIELNRGGFGAKVSKRPNLPRQFRRKRALSMAQQLAHPGRGTDGSNPASSSKESAANLNSP